MFIKTALWFLFFFAIGMAGAYSQQSVLAASGEDSGTTGSISFSIGQAACLSVADTSGFIIQGVQQPYEIQFLPGVDEIPGAQVECTLYPNPTSSNISLRIKGIDLYLLHYMMADLLGHTVAENPVVSHEVVIPMEHFPPGIYILSLVEHTKILRQFKIIKR